MTNFAEKYRPKKYQDLIGQDKAIAEVKQFLKDYPRQKALLLHGPPGTGKTTLALIAAAENNREIFELNSSDLRNRTKLEEVLKPATLQTGLFKKNKIILVDEVDGVTGTDIGGIPELVRIIEVASHPIIITGNDIWQSKISPVRQKSKLVEMKSLTTEDIVQLLKTICTKEQLVLPETTIRHVAMRSQGDVRAALNDLHIHATGEPFADVAEKRHREQSIFNILKLLFQERQDFLELFDSTDMSLDEILLWIEENIPKEYSDPKALAKAYEALGNADRFRGRIYRQQYWHFLLYQNIFQSAGIAYAKDKPKPGFIKYETPKRVLKIWMNNQKIAKKKTIAQKYAKHVHCSTKRALRDFELLRPILQKTDVQAQIRLEEDEIEYLGK